MEKHAKGSKKAAHIVEETMVDDSKSGVGAWKWWYEGTLNCGSTSGDVDSTKLALFDMDGNLINTKSGKSNPIDGNDWVLWNPCIPAKLQELKKQGFRIIIVSNQKGVSLGLTTIEALRKKVENLSKVFGVEMSALMATDDDQYRKPNIGMWKHITKTLNKTAVTKSECVGKV